VSGIAAGIWPLAAALVGPVATALAGEVWFGGFAIDGLWVGDSLAGATFESDGSAGLVSSIAGGCSSAQAVRPVASSKAVSGRVQ
jgi:hypothetical protein